MDELKLEKAKMLIKKKKELTEAQKELEKLKTEYAEELCPIKIGDVVKADDFKKSDIKIYSVFISYITEQHIVFMCRGVMRNKDGEFGNRTLSKRVELKI
ncbi:hypothetical protein NMV19_11215 [Pasteurella multocida]|uniref:hypothetical protein n=1 Tax=Pasteurella multocida TaxID=747 RepID=UPI002A4EA8A9|nr:hypothetical protein [Pasteurella multocida]MDY0495186.1 hypothetical protein [Pasteurella multocida]MDY0523014.1 hypothetical protein [Pasteurella multocida]MDY0609080.1 hypothetical protein [Pasteurella multocida]MDY0616959.1 hypothetical protein [Pasteurella multocida]